MSDTNAQVPAELQQLVIGERAETAATLAAAVFTKSTATNPTDAVQIFADVYRLLFPQGS